MKNLGGGGDFKILGFETLNFCTSGQMVAVASCDLLAQGCLALPSKLMAILGAAVSAACVCKPITIIQVSAQLPVIN